jgi:general secretion pathway protein L
MADSMLSLSLNKLMAANELEAHDELVDDKEFDIASEDQRNSEEQSVLLIQPDVSDQPELQALRASSTEPVADDDSNSDIGVKDVEKELLGESLEKKLVSRIDQIDRLIRSENIATQRMQFSETATELISIHVVRSLDQQLNLLQGDFRPANANEESRRIARLTGFAVAACLGVFLIITLLGGTYLNWRADGYFDKSVAAYKEVFPKQRRVRSPAKEMQRKLSGQAVGASASEFLPLLDAASGSLTALVEQTSADANIQQLRYDLQRGNIAIDIQTDNIDQLETYKDLLTQQGLSVDILSANQDGNIVKGRIQIGRS